MYYKNLLSRALVFFIFMTCVHSVSAQQTSSRWLAIAGVAGVVGGIAGWQLRKITQERNSLTAQAEYAYEQANQFSVQRSLAYLPVLFLASWIPKPESANTGEEKKLEGLFHEIKTHGSLERYCVQLDSSIAASKTFQSTLEAASRTVMFNSTCVRKLLTKSQSLHDQDGQLTQMKALLVRSATYMQASFDNERVEQYLTKPDRVPLLSKLCDPDNLSDGYRVRDGIVSAMNIPPSFACNTPCITYLTACIKDRAQGQELWAKMQHWPREYSGQYPSLTGRINDNIEKMLKITDDLHVISYTACLHEDIDVDMMQYKSGDPHMVKPSQFISDRVFRIGESLKKNNSAKGSLREAFLRMPAITLADLQLQLCY